MNPRRTHELVSFFKYMPASTAKIVLRNKTLRWSSPTEFNDPFDVPAELAYDIAPSEIRAEISRILIELFRDGSVEIAGYLPNVQAAVTAVRQSDKATKDAVEQAFRERQNTGFEKYESLNEIRQMWGSFIPAFRILCLSEINSAASMWYHYADKYRGVVIEIACIDELDSPWLLAKKVNYPVEPPDLFSARGWAELMLTPKEKSLSKVLDAYTYNKTPDWRYEEEWRITSFKRSGESGTVSDYPLNSSHFTKIYFGPLICSDDREEILSIVKNDISHAKLFDVTFGLSRKFQFTEIGNG